MCCMFKKIGVSLLLTLMLVFGSHIIGDMLVKVDEVDVAALRIGADAKMDDEEEMEEAPAETEIASEDSDDMGMAGMLATADVVAGEKAFKKCKSCHSVENGGKHKVGPNLWNIVGGKPGSAAGYKYSNALTGLDGEWSYDSLNAFLANPKEFAPGTKMSFSGIKKPEVRAALIVYLRAQSDSPLPLP